MLRIDTGVGGKPAHAAVDDRTGQPGITGPRARPEGAAATFALLSAPVEEPADAVVDGSANRDDLDEIGDMHGTALLAGNSVVDGNGSHDNGSSPDGHGSFDNVGLPDGDASFDNVGLPDGNGSFDNAGSPDGNGFFDNAGSLGHAMILGSGGPVDDAMIINGTLALPGSALYDGNLGGRGEPSDHATRPTDMTEEIGRAHV